MTATEILKKFQSEFGNGIRKDPHFDESFSIIVDNLEGLNTEGLDDFRCRVLEVAEEMASDWGFNWEGEEGYIKITFFKA